MKKLILVLLAVVLFTSCSTQKPANDAAKKEEVKISIDVKAETKFKGDWTLTKVTYVGQEYFKITSFQLADSKCFIGSRWNFISNNNKGTLTINTGSCPAFSSPIVWSVSKEKMFSLKILSDMKAREVKVGFYFLVQNQTENSFVLSDRMDIGGKLTEVVYKFEKQ